MIELDHVNKVYESGEIRVHAVKNVTLSLPHHEFIAFIGPSGSGKTTLLNILGTLDTASSGTYKFDDIDITRLQKKDRIQFRRDTLGFVFQHFNLIPGLSVYDNVEVPLLILQEKDRRARVMEALASVGLQDYAKHRPGQLSGGQQQRVSIARALVKKPRLILADEPTANLDQATSKEVIGVLSELKSRYKSTIILCTHDPLVIDKTDRSIEIIDGVIAGRSAGSRAHGESRDA